MAGSPITILLVDDEKDFVEMLALRLTEEGHSVRTALNGEEALAGLAEFEPDVVLLDLKMPKKDGITVLKAIKATCPAVEVLLLTGHGTSDATLEGLRAGAFDCLIKPADFQDLMEKIEFACSQKTGRQKRPRPDHAHGSPGVSNEM